MDDVTVEFQVECNEALIKRVRIARGLGMTLEETILHFLQRSIASEATYLAWHAAGILDTPWTDA